MKPPTVISETTLSQWALTAVNLIIEQANQAILSRGSWSLVLAGGSTPRPVYQTLAAHKDQINWQKTYIFWGDERCVPPDDPASNYRMAKQTLLDAVPVPQQNIFRILGEIPPEIAAKDYQGTIDAHFNKSEKRFDTLLLGLGEDGHTASLFQGEPTLDEASAWVIPSRNPHTQTDRLTLTFPAINAARSIIFLVTGDNKARIVADIIQNPNEPPAYPAKRVTGTDSTPIWILDQAAALKLA